ncbi:hypothetical protein ACED30_23920, partial [Vibrio splendidus]|uniref:hypothetical protein n=1 Tax=Vibrio splendidus TaxID=29497 RepID=UPI00352F9AB0
EKLLNKQANDDNYLEKHRDRCINSLTIAKDELSENDADVSVVRKYLKRASDLTKDIQLGLSVYGKIEDVLAQISSC